MAQAEKKSSVEIAQAVQAGAQDFKQLLQGAMNADKGSQLKTTVEHNATKTQAAESAAPVTPRQ